LEALRALLPIFFYSRFSTGGFHVSENDASLSQVVASGDRFKSLESLRNLLAEAIESCESKRDLAALSRQLVSVLAQIEDHRGLLAPSFEDDTLSLTHVQGDGRASGC
jgi:hypothetical protein